MGGSDSQRIILGIAHRLEETRMMLAADHKGNLVYANTPLANMLGFKLDELKVRDLASLLPPPYSLLHAQLIKVWLGLARSHGQVEWQAETWCDGCLRNFANLQKCQPDFKNNRCISCLLSSLTGHRRPGRAPAARRLPQCGDCAPRQLQQHTGACTRQHRTPARIAGPPSDVVGHVHALLPGGVCG